jgi:5-formyltetrahydrofolate cyclo-ligase
MDKSKWARREDAKSRRDNISAPVRRELSRRICARVMAWIEMRKVETVMLYLSMRSEVETDGLLDYLITEGKTVLAPATDVAKKSLIPYRLTDPAMELRTHPFGMREPDPRLCHAFPLEAIDLICVPGLAFDRRGYRIGYGGGYYDRFLPCCPQATWMGMAFEAQIIDDTQPQRGDVPLHLIATERRVL